MSVLTSSKPENATHVGPDAVSPTRHLNHACVLPAGRYPTIPHLVLVIKTTKSVARYPLGSSQEYPSTPITLFTTGSLVGLPQMRTRHPAGRYPAIPRPVLVRQLPAVLHPYWKHMHGRAARLENTKPVAVFLLHRCALPAISLFTDITLRQLKAPPPPTHANTQADVSSAETFTVYQQPVQCSLRQP